MDDDNTSREDIVFTNQTNIQDSQVKSEANNPQTGKVRKVINLKTVKLWFKRNLAVVIIIIIVLLLGLVAFLIYQKMNPKIQSLSSNNQVVADYNKKLTGLKASVEKDSSSSSAHKNYAIALYVTKNYDSAIKEYEAALKIDGDDSVTYNNLGNAYRDIKNYDKAIECYKKAIEKDSELVNPYINLANVQLYSKKDSDAAIATYKIALEALPNNSQIELLLGSTYEYLGKPDEARQVYENILGHDSENVAAKSNLERMDKN